MLVGLVVLGAVLAVFGATLARGGGSWLNMTFGFFIMLLALSNLGSRAAGRRGGRLSRGWWAAIVGVAVCCGGGIAVTVIEARDVLDRVVPGLLVLALVLVVGSLIKDSRRGTLGRSSPSGG